MAEEEAKDKDLEGTEADVVDFPLPFRGFPPAAFREDVKEGILEVEEEEEEEAATLDLRGNLRRRTGVAPTGPVL